jgi:hypothetical protein
MEEGDNAGAHTSFFSQQYYLKGAKIIAAESLAVTVCR